MGSSTFTALIDDPSTCVQIVATSELVSILPLLLLNFDYTFLISSFDLKVLSNKYVAIIYF